MNGDPIFIVGAPRSGTTLLAAQLSAHSKLSCGPETHFFRWLATTSTQPLLDRHTWPQAALDFIASIRYRQFQDQSTAQLITKYGVTLQEIETALRDAQPSVAAMLASITEPYMRAAGKVRWVEKTPDHIEHLQLIRRHFPRSPIIHIVRDPRDVALSLTRVPWGAASLTEAFLHIRKLDCASADFLENDPGSHTLHFEDLLQDPRRELQKICDFIDEPFEARMLNTAETGQRVNSRNAPWKEKASQPIDKDRIAVWRKELTPAQNRLAEAIVGNILQRHNYPVDQQPPTLAALFPTDQMLLKHDALVDALLDRGIRLWQQTKDEQPTVKIFVGDPSHVSWLGQSHSQRLASTFAIATDILRARRSGQQLYWIPVDDNASWSGLSAHLLSRLLAPHKLPAQSQLETET